MPGPSVLCAACRRYHPVDGCCTGLQASTVPWLDKVSTAAPRPTYEQCVEAMGKALTNLAPSKLRGSAWAEFAATGMLEALRTFGINIPPKPSGAEETAK